jgi:hypothetical protein
MSSRLLIDEPPLVVIPSLAKALGLNEAIVLQQIHYWLNPKFNKNFINNRYWVWKTYKQWGEEFGFWGDKTVRRAIDSLEQEGLLITFKKTAQFKTVKYYTIDYDCLNTLLSNKNKPSCGEELAKNDVPPCKLNSDMDITIASSSPEEGVSLNSPCKNPASNIKPPEIQENCGSYRNGHIDQLDVPVWANRCGQNDQHEMVNMTKPYNKEYKNTFKKITLPPPSKIPHRPEQKKEEEEDLNFKFQLLGRTMIDIWNKTIQKKLDRPPIFSTPHRVQKLIHLLNSLMNGDIAQWKAYCDKIASCRFLMERQPSGFQIGLDWAIDPNNSVKILEGAIYDKPVVSNAQSKEEKAEDFLSILKKKCMSETEDLRWFNFCQNLFEQIGIPNFKSWFLKAFPQAFEEEEVILTFPSPFMADYVQNNYYPVIQKALKRTFPNLKRVQIVTRTPQEEERHV